MPTIVFIEPDGQQKSVTSVTGQSLMQAAVQNGVRGIEADCGGSCTCATCHAYIDPQWTERLPAIRALEQDMLEFALDTNEHSRLTCQIQVTDELDGLVVRIPHAQA